MGATAKRSKVVASGNVVGGTFALNGAYNCAGVKNGTGDYSITLGTEADQDEAIVIVTPLTADQSVHVVHTSDSVKQFLVRTISGTPAAADGNFTFTVVQYAL